MDSGMIFNLILIVLAAWFILTRFGPTKGLKNMSPRQFQDVLEDKASNVMLIDVREPFEYSSGHIPKAVNIPLSQLKQKLGDIPKDKRVLLYCRSGMRSKQAGRVLSKQGYREMGNLAGGIMAWGGAIKKK